MATHVVCSARAGRMQARWWARPPQHQAACYAGHVKGGEGAQLSVNVDAHCGVEHGLDVTTLVVQVVARQGGIPVHVRRRWGTWACWRALPSDGACWLACHGMLGPSAGSCGRPGRTSSCGHSLVRDVAERDVLHIGAGVAGSEQDLHTTPAEGVW
jgi:hypothetical protein